MYFCIKLVQYNSSASAILNWCFFYSDKINKSFSSLYPQSLIDQNPFLLFHFTHLKLLSHHCSEKQAPQHDSYHTVLFCLVCIITITTLSLFFSFLFDFQSYILLQIKSVFSDRPHHHDMHVCLHFSCHTYNIYSISCTASTKDIRCNLESFFINFLSSISAAFTTWENFCEYFSSAVTVFPT